MNIIVDGRYLIQRDKYQFILREIGTNKEGEEILKIPSFYPKLSDLIRALILREITDATINSLEDMEKEISAICERIAKNFNTEVTPAAIKPDCSEFD